MSAVAISVTLAACGTTNGASNSARTRTLPSTSATPLTARAAANPLSGAAAVSISGYAYHPATITITPGTKVTFTNHDQTAHTATSTRSAFDTGTVQPGESKPIAFNTPGTYTYYCQFHAFMRGTIVVK